MMGVANRKADTMSPKITISMDADAARMAKGPPGPDATDADRAHWGRLVGQKLNAIEGNPFTENDVALFRDFEDQGLSHEECVRRIIDEAKGKSAALKASSLG